MKKIILLLNCLSILTTLGASSAERLNEFTDPNTLVLAIPDLNGIGAKPDDVAQMLNISAEKVIPVSSPLVYADLGQSHCQRILKNAMQLPPASRVLLYAENEGCATAINYAADKKLNIVGIICKGAVASGSEAICHRMKAEAPRTQALPFYNYTAPYFGKLFSSAIFPRSVMSFSVSGQQPIHSIKHINPNIPIIFVPDKSVPIADSHALMGARRIKQSSVNSYLASSTKDQNQAIQACLKAESVFAFNGSREKLINENEVLTRNQHSISQANDTAFFQDAHQEQLHRERIRTCVDYTLKASLGLAAAYGIYKLAPTVKNAISSRVLVPT